jgi:glycosidase
MINRTIVTPDWVNGRAIYEVNLRQFTKEGTIKAFKEHIPRLKELGIGIVWFMPLQPIGKKNRKGALGSYYSISNYSSINPEFGTFGEFKSLVKKLHDLDIKVVIDWVANHTAWDHHWTKDHPEYYLKDKNGQFKPPVPEWEDVIDLNYDHKPLRNAMIDEMKFWLEETDIDGFRCDMAHLVPTEFWNEARKQLDQVKPVYMLAESENHDLLEHAFDTIYNWKLLHAMNEVAAGKKGANDLMKLVISELTFIPNGASFLNFTSNHDENSWQGSAIERLHYFLEPLTVLTFVLPGLPLIYTGQEAGNYRRLKFFDKDKVDWKHDKMFPLYQKLNGLRKTRASYWNNGQLIELANDKPAEILSCRLYDHNTERNLILMLNLSDRKQHFHIKCENINGFYKNSLEMKDYNLNCHKPINLKPFSFILLIDESK